MLKNAYFLTKIGADTAENERNFAKNWQPPYGSSAVHVQPDRAAVHREDPGDGVRELVQPHLCWVADSTI